jgi:DNA polymerase III delta subunit
VHRAAVLLEAGMPEQKVGPALKMPPWAVKRTLAQARKADREALERALEAMAEFERDSRGGGDKDLDEQTAFTMTLASASRA